MVDKAIEIKELNYVYPDGTKALRQISLDIFVGESVGIIGYNGAGKTTLLLHLNGILRGNGFIRVLGEEIDSRKLAQVRENVGLVFQDPENQLFMPNVFEDISFGPMNMNLSKTEVESSVNKALREVGMPDAGRRSSHHLSFGEKKRISIATVLAMNPQILVLDEPTSNLDPRGRRDIIGLLKGIDKTKIIASHDLEMVSQVCSRYIFLDKGRIIKSSSTTEDLSTLFSY